MTPEEIVARAIWRSLEPGKVQDEWWQHHTPEARAALSALEEAGYAVVPAEATGKMWEAGKEADAHPGDSYSAIWRAMLDAAAHVPPGSTKAQNV
jgi:hypothetical protein